MRPPLSAPSLEDLVPNIVIAIAKANGLYVFTPTNNSAICTWTTAPSSPPIVRCAPTHRTALSSRSRRRAILVLLMSNLVLRPACGERGDIYCGSLCLKNRSSAVHGGSAACKAVKYASRFVTTSEFSVLLCIFNSCLIFRLFCDHETVRLRRDPYDGSINHQR